MDKKQFCLKWNNYLDVFHGSFVALLNSEHFADVTLSCDSQSIKCHRLVLSSCSSYFETLLLGISNPHPIIILKDVEFHDLLALVKFIYTGEVTVPEAQTSSLIKVAEILKVKGLAYSDETANEIQTPSYLAQNTQMTQPAVKRNSVDTTSENNFLAEDSSSNLELPVADTSNNMLVNYPAETSSSVYQTDIAVCSPLQVKDEFGLGIEKGWNNSSSQFKDDGAHFDYGSEKLIENQILERIERKPNTSFNFSGSSKLQSDTQESGATAFDCQGVADTSSNNTNTPKEFSNSNIGFNRKKCGKYFECSICDKRFHFRSKLERHQRVHTGKKPFKCDICQKSYSRADSLNIHQRLHTGVADTSSSNTNTPKGASNSNIGFNKKKCRKYYECEICDKTFHFRSILERHQRIHTGKKPFKCDICQKSFSRADSLNIHQRLHTGEKPYKCDVCEKRFCDSGSLVKHQRVHTGEKPFKCDVCKKRFSQSSNFYSHQKVHERACSV